MAWVSSIVNPLLRPSEPIKFPRTDAGTEGVIHLWNRVRRVTVVYDTTSVTTVTDGISPGVDSVTTINQTFSGSAYIPYGESDDNYVNTIGSPWQGAMLGGPQRYGQCSWRAQGTGTYDLDVNGSSSSTPITFSVGSLQLVNWSGDPSYEDTLGDMRNSKWLLAVDDLGDPGRIPPLDWQDFDDGAVITQGGSYTTTSDDGLTVSNLTYSRTITLATS